MRALPLFCLALIACGSNTPGTPDGSIGFTGGGGGTTNTGGGTTNTGGGGSTSTDAGPVSTLGWHMVAPDHRSAACLAVDPVNDTLLLVGGSREFTARGLTTETWSWNGTRWTQLHPATTGPSSGRCVTDTVRNRVIVFAGGQQTWEWDGTDWRVINQGLGTARTGFSFAFSSALGKPALFGGTTDGSVFFDDVWTWDGARWTQLATATQPSARRDAALADHPPSQKLILAGGHRLQQVSTEAGLWALSGTAWTEASSRPTFDDYENVRATWSPTRMRTVVMGKTLGDLSEFDGTTVTFPTVTGGAPVVGLASWPHLVAWRDLLVLHGIAYVPEEHVLWKLSGNDWSPLVSAPDRRTGAAVAWLPSRKHFIVTGGTIESKAFGGPSTRATDTWEFDGASWSKLEVNGAPTGEACIGSTEPLSGDVVVLCRDATGASGLWRFNGTAWSVMPITSLNTAPSGLGTWDGALAVNTNGSISKWTGSAFAAVDQSGSGTSQSIFGFDPVRKIGVQYGGRVSTGALTTTWTLAAGTSQWLELTTATTPPACTATQCTMLWLPEKNRLGVFMANGALWTFDGTDWSLESIPSGIKTSGYGLARDEEQNRYFFFGGQFTGENVSLNDAWYFSF